MSKRRPDVQLTRDNFDRGSDEEGGDDIIDSEPKIASQDVLKSRPMVKAKRRLGSDNVEGSNGTAANLFSGFKSTFGSSGNNNNTLGKFNFGASSFNSSTPTFGSSSLTVPSFSDSKTPTTTIVPSKSENSDSNSTNSGNHMDSKLASNETEPKKDADAHFTANLTELNKVFYEHVKKYTETSMLYDFTVVCQEYINQYKTIKEKKSTSVPNNNSVPKNANQSDEKKSDGGLFKFGEKTSDTSSTFKIPAFSFGQTPTVSTTLGTATESKSLFSFGSTGNASLFGERPHKFALPTVTKEQNEESAGGGEGGDEDTPPKVVSVEHSENDAVYTKKCKLYYQKDGSFVDKGIGFLYIKLKDDSKPQLLIRADTTTGNILLNIALVESLPVIKADKGKGVMLTCIPNPEIEPKKKSDQQENGEDKQTVTFLIRVKVSDNDELYDSIVKYKSQS